MKSTKYIELTSCPFCKSKNIFQFKKRSDDLWMMKCNVCTLGFVEKYPENIMDLYDEDYFDKNENKPFGYPNYSEYTYNFFIWAAAMIQLTEKKGNILDIGAGNGLLLELVKNIGFNQLDGIELNNDYAKIANEKGFDVKTESILDLNLKQNHYDVITAFEVLEHIPELDQVLEKVKGALKDDGFFFFFTPCMTKMEEHHEHMLSSSLEHIFYFSDESLRKIFKHHFGNEVVMRVIDFQNAPSSGAVGFICKNLELNKKFEKFNHLFNSVERKDLENLSPNELKCLTILYLRFFEDLETAKLISEYMYTRRDQPIENYFLAYTASNFAAYRIYNRQLLEAKEYYLKQIENRDKIIEDFNNNI